jgi:parvulin-like peptidyl-prolyl isomerase
VTAEFDRFKSRFPDEKTMTEQLASGGTTTDGVKSDIRKFLQQNHWLDAQLAGKTEVTEGEAETFFKENPDQFKAPEQVRASHILVGVPEGSKDDQVKVKKEAADKILARVKKGEDFDKLATELSEDPSAKENHGDLNFFGREQMVPEFSEAAFKLKKGEISPEPVRSDFGFHIIKVTDRKEPSSMTFPEVKPQLMAFLQQQKRQTETGKVLRTLREGAKVTVNLPDAE